MANELNMNVEGFASQSFNNMEEFDDFGKRLESNSENISDNEILSKFDDNQLDYINSIQENPSWHDMGATEKIEYVKNAVDKFCHNTEIGRYWSKPAHWHPIVQCLIKHMPKI